MGKKNSEICAFLGKGTDFNGKLILTESVRIDGRFKGEISGTGTLIVGEGAHVEADIAVDNILILGEVRGVLDIREKVEICSSGILSGNLKTAAFVVQEGASFEGDCSMDNHREQKRKESGETKNRLIT